MTRDEMLQILEKNRYLIENKNFQEFYEELYEHDRPYFTDLFLKSGINPLDYMKKVPDYFAYQLENLGNVDIPNNIKNIGDNAFSGCSSLTSITIAFGENSKLTYISWYAFCDCISLTSIEIPSNVTCIGEYAFYDSSNLKNIYYK